MSFQRGFVRERESIGGGLKEAKPNMTTFEAIDPMSSHCQPQG
jgi:hypothetical protein